MPRREIKRALAFSMALGLLAAVSPVRADDMPGMSHAAPGDSASQGYMDAMHKMDADMPKETGDVDVDFVQMMIPHHQGAIDMAKILLKQSKDPTLLKLGAKIIEDQNREIDEMRDWLGKHKQ